MKLSTRSTYGVRFMTILALRYGHGPVLLREVAERESLSEKYLGQIVMPLRSGSLIHSVRGARGGYALAREPREINLREIVEVLEGGLEIVDTETPTAGGHSLASIVIGRVWQQLSSDIVESLSGITLEEIVRRVHEGGESPAMYNI
ncbi:MAG TPA: Rrf2 family transcriptional regulator [Spirochaetia bacterium]|nr:Rrf2 family transcriptional regulator [Spirochaetia bacterium]